MKFSDIPRDPDRKTLRGFGYLWLGFFGLAACYSYYQGYNTWAAALLALSLGVGIPGTAYPQILKPVFVTWMILVFPIGWTISHILLTLMYFFVFAPFGLVLRLFGHDPLRLKESNEDSFWRSRSSHNDPSRYLKQY